MSSVHPIAPGWRVKITQRPIGGYIHTFAKLQRRRYWIFWGDVAMDWTDHCVNTLWTKETMNGFKVIIAALAGEQA